MTPPDNLTLADMDEARFREYRERSVRDYANEKIRAGTWSPEEAETKAAQEMAALLPEGTATRNHFLYTVIDESLPAEVGILWISQQESGTGRFIWIYDILIHEPFRRQGYARRALNLVEHKARELNATKVDLHVFAHNQGARTLYENTGYKPTSITMSKPITTTDS